MKSARPSSSVVVPSSQLNQCGRKPIGEIGGKGSAVSTYRSKWYGQTIIIEKKQLRSAASQTFVLRRFYCIAMNGNMEDYQRSSAENLKVGVHYDDLHKIWGNSPTQNVRLKFNSNLTKLTNVNRLRQGRQSLGL